MEEEKQQQIEQHETIHLERDIITVFREKTSPNPFLEEKKKLCKDPVPFWQQGRTWNAHQPAPWVARLRWFSFKRTWRKLGESSLVIRRRRGCAYAFVFAPGVYVFFFVFCGGGSMVFQGVFQGLLFLPKGLLVLFVKFQGTFWGAFFVVYDGELKV